MNKLHSLALSTLLAPAIMLSSSAVLAQQSAGQDQDNAQQSSQHQPGTAQSSTGASQSSQSMHRPGQSESPTAASRRNADSQSDAPLVAGQRNSDDQTRQERRGYMDAAPANGMHASNLIGAEIKTSGDDEVGEVSDLIIDEQGQVVAVVVGVGGFLGMGEKDVAIGWDDVTKSSGTDDDEDELRINMTREELTSAPEFKRDE